MNHYLDFDFLVTQTNLITPRFDFLFNNSYQKHLKFLKAIMKKTFNLKVATLKKDL